MKLPVSDHLSLTSRVVAYGRFRSRAQFLCSRTCLVYSNLYHFYKTEKKLRLTILNWRFYQLIQVDNILFKMILCYKSKVGFTNNIWTTENKTIWTSSIPKLPRLVWTSLHPIAGAWISFLSLQLSVWTNNHPSSVSMVLDTDDKSEQPANRIWTSSHWALLATCEPRVNHVESPPVKVTQTKKDYSPLKRIMLFSYAAERF